VKLATVATPTGSRAARIADGGEAVLLPYPDVVSLLQDPSWRQIALGEGEEGDVELGSLPAVRPNRTLCVGLNYRSHVLETNNEVPEYPTLFAKFPGTLTGATSDVTLPDVSTKVDWEAELGIVIGTPAYGVSDADALQHIAGFTAVNDVSMRDWQRRTSEWLQGKNFDASTPVGPVVTTSDEIDDAADLLLTCHVDGVLMQEARTSDLIFGPAKIVSYISTFMRLEPGDLISTGTCGGVAIARPDQPFLKDGQVATVTIEGIGSCVNTFRAEG